MRKKVLSIVCMLLVGSVFSLSYSIYCDLWMSHSAQAESLAQESAHSCHDSKEATKSTSPSGKHAGCPILLNLEGSVAISQADSVRIEKRSQWIVWLHPASTHGFQLKVEKVALAPESSAAKYSPLPIYLRNPVLRI